MHATQTPPSLFTAEGLELSTARLGGLGIRQWLGLDQTCHLVQPFADLGGLAFEAMCPGVEPLGQAEVGP